MMQAYDIRFWEHGDAMNTVTYRVIELGTGRIVTSLRVPVASKRGHQRAWSHCERWIRRAQGNPSDGDLWRLGLRYGTIKQGSTCVLNRHLSAASGGRRDLIQQPLPITVDQQQQAI